MLPSPWMSCATYLCFALFMYRDSCSLLNLRSPVVLVGKLGPLLLVNGGYRTETTGTKEVNHTQN
jgi:hypothetical protein